MTAAKAEAIIHWSARDREHDHIKCAIFKINVLIVSGFVLYMYKYIYTCVFSPVGLYIHRICRYRCRPVHCAQ